MVLQMQKGILDSERADVTFPTTLAKVQTEMRGLEEFGKRYGVVRSVKCPWRGTHSAWLC